MKAFCGQSCEVFDKSHQSVFGSSPVDLDTAFEQVLASSVLIPDEWKGTTRSILQASVGNASDEEVRGDLLPQRTPRGFSRCHRREIPRLQQRDSHRAQRGRGRARQQRARQAQRAHQLRRGGLYGRSGSITNLVVVVRDNDDERGGIITTWSRATTPGAATGAAEGAAAVPKANSMSVDRPSSFPLISGTKHSEDQVIIATPTQRPQLNQFDILKTSPHLILILYNQLRRPRLNFYLRRRRLS